MKAALPRGQTKASPFLQKAHLPENRQLLEALKTIEEYSAENDRLHQKLNDTQIVQKLRNIINVQQSTIDNLTAEKANLIQFIQYNKSSSGQGHIDAPGQGSTHDSPVSSQTLFMLSVLYTFSIPPLTHPLHKPSRCQGADLLVSFEGQYKVLVSRIQRLTELFNRGREYQHSLTEDLSKSKRINKRFRTKLKVSISQPEHW